jgi:hypothetical protein
MKKILLQVIIFVFLLVGCTTEPKTDGSNNDFNNFLKDFDYKIKITHTDSLYSYISIVMENQQNVIIDSVYVNDNNKEIHYRGINTLVRKSFDRIINGAYHTDYRIEFNFITNNEYYIIIYMDGRKCEGLLEIPNDVSMINPPTAFYENRNNVYKWDIKNEPQMLFFQRWGSSSGTFKWDDMQEYKYIQLSPETRTYTIKANSFKKQYGWYWYGIWCMNYFTSERIIVYGSGLFK